MKLSDMFSPIVSGGTDKVFGTHDQIRKALFHVTTLSEAQRAEIMPMLTKELDDGGVTREEMRKVILDLRHKGEISEVDQINLLKFI